MLKTDGYEKMVEFKFPFDKKQHCQEWYSHFVLIQAAKYGILMVIFLGNIIIEIIVRAGGSFTRPVSESAIIMQTIRAISWI